MTNAANGYVNMMSWQRFRRPFLSQKGYFGLVPDTAAVGDVVVVFEGAKFPYVLRKCEDEVEEKYTLVGEAYVHGIMYGEFAEQPKESERKAFRMR